jgi:hypothetical protein
VFEAKGAFAQPNAETNTKNTGNRCCFMKSFTPDSYDSVTGTAHGAGER